MKLNKFSLFLTAMCALAPLSLHPMFSAGRSFMNRFSRTAMTVAGAVGAGVWNAHSNKADCAIIRLETYEMPTEEPEKSKCTKITIAHDLHSIGGPWGRVLLEYPEHEQALFDYFTMQTNNRVYIEDVAEHVGSKDIQNKTLPNLLHSMRPGSLLGMVERAKAVGIQALSVDPRAGVLGFYSGPNEDVVYDYRKTVEKLKAATPITKLDVYTNKILEYIQKRDEPSLTREDSFITIKPYDNLGLEVVDMLALKELCKPEGKHEHRVFIGGSMHCEDIALSLQHFGYNRTHNLGNSWQEVSPAYEQFLSDGSDRYTVEGMDSSARADLLIEGPLAPEQITDYFKNPRKYSVRQPCVDRLRNPDKFQDMF